MMQVAELSQPARSVEGGNADLQASLDRGLRFAHVMMSINHFEGREGVVYARALTELLLNKGMVDQQELETMVNQVRQDLEAQPAPRVMLASTPDKYAPQRTVTIDCASRIHICKARCCTFNFYLTDQDLDEGMARWDYGRPYWIQKRPDEYCVHCDPSTRRCQIHQYRPYVCRSYDCREDERIWVDFERMIPNPEL
jgi:Fe-S-cluster containining protein